MPAVLRRPRQGIRSTAMSRLKLFALDTEDLEVVSAHLQDAVARVADIAWLPAGRRFVMLVNRFDWSAGEAGRGEYRRNRSALSFDRVTGVRRQGLRQDDPDAVVNLLAVRFSGTDAPAGTVDLLFSGGGTIRLEVECIECRLADLGPAWSTGSRPAHDVGEAGTADRDGA